ncbi:MAG: GTP pyrophosphokinase family protein [Sphaerochaetaceae bacterium]
MIKKEIIPNTTLDSIGVDTDWEEKVQLFVENMYLYKSAIQQINTKLEILDNDFKVKNDYNPIHHIESRIKTPESIIQKALRKNLSFSDSWKDNITDIAGIRVICNYKEDVYSISKQLLKQEDITLLKEKDYILHPKESGYKALHLIIETPVYLTNSVEHVPVEIQIRTIAMDTWASLEHELKYKNKNGLDEKTIKKLKRCATKLSEIDQELQDIHNEQFLSQESSTKSYSVNTLLLELL